MAENIQIDVKIDDGKLIAMFDSLINDEVMTEIHQVLAEMCNPYVPYLTGALSGKDAQELQIDADGVHYTQPYAHYQYYGTHFNHTLVPHPRATALWDKVMMSEQGDVFIQRVTEILSRRAKELYG